jgi:hypothetical protein
MEKHNDTIGSGPVTMRSSSSDLSLHTKTKVSGHRSKTFSKSNSMIIRHPKKEVESGLDSIKEDSNGSPRSPKSSITTVITPTSPRKEAKQKKSSLKSHRHQSERKLTRPNTVARLKIPESGLEGPAERTLSPKERHMSFYRTMRAGSLTAAGKQFELPQTDRPSRSRSRQSIITAQAVFEQEEKGEKSAREAEQIKTRAERGNFLFTLKRSNSVPYLNTWEYGNIDADFNVPGLGKSKSHNIAIILLKDLLFFVYAFTLTNHD